MGSACNCDHVGPLCDRCASTTRSPTSAAWPGRAAADGPARSPASSRSTGRGRRRPRASARWPGGRSPTSRPTERLRELFVDRCVEGAARWWDHVLRPGLWRVS